MCDGYVAVRGIDGWSMLRLLQLQQFNITNDATRARSMIKRRLQWNDDHDDDDDEPKRRSVYLCLALAQSWLLLTHSDSATNQQNTIKLTTQPNSMLCAHNICVSVYVKYIYICMMGDLANERAFVADVAMYYIRCAKRRHHQKWWRIRAVYMEKTCIKLESLKESARAMLITLCVHHMYRDCIHSHILYCAHTTPWRDDKRHNVTSNDVNTYINLSHSLITRYVSIRYARFTLRVPTTQSLFEVYYYRWLNVLSCV